MGRATATLAGILVLALIAGGLTEVTLAVGHRQGISDDAVLAPKSTPTPSLTPHAKATPSPTATPSATPTPTATPGSVATTNSFVHLRQEATTSSEILENLNGGTTVQLLSYEDDQWQEVSVNGVQGYIFKSYLTY